MYFLLKYKYRLNLVSISVVIKPFKVACAFHSQTTKVAIKLMQVHILAYFCHFRFLMLLNDLCLDQYCYQYNFLLELLWI